MKSKFQSELHDVQRVLREVKGILHNLWRKMPVVWHNQRIAQLEAQVLQLKQELREANLESEIYEENLTASTEFLLQLYRDAVESKSDLLVKALSRELRNRNIFMPEDTK